MHLLYSLFVRLYVLGIRFTSLWNPKAAAWVSGRKTMWAELEKNIHHNDRVIWIHCASAGEFEQGKPVIDALKEQYPSHKILVSFFSPSGYQVAKKYTKADHITYLPADTRTNARRFIEAAHPELAIFIKYEFWYHHLSAAAFRHIPILLVAAIFRKNQVFFKWYGKFYRQMLFLFRHIFVQDSASLQLLTENAVAHCSLGGDTRFDRVSRIAGAPGGIEEIKSFASGKPLIVAGSTWPEDEMLFEKLATEGARIVFAPHEIHASHLKSMEKMFPGAVRFSSYQQHLQQSARVLIIDNFGMLSRLYQYATLTYIGGGFNRSGIHNTLEAAVYGKPVIFGPNYQKFKEARDLIATGGAFSIANRDQLKEKVETLLHEPTLLALAGKACRDYVENNTGATEKVMDHIYRNRLLTI